MVKRLSNKLHSPMKFVVLIGSLVYFTLILICSFGGMSDNFFGVVAHLTITILTLIALAAIPVFVLIKKDNIARIVFSLLSGYWLISRSREMLAYAYSFDANGDGLWNTLFIFGFFYGLALVAAFVFILLGYIFKKDGFKTIAWFILAGSILFAYIVGILQLAAYGNANALDWTRVVNVIAVFFIHPILIPAGCLYFNKVEK